MITPEFYHSSPGNSHCKYLPTSTEAHALSHESVAADLTKVF